VRIYDLPDWTAGRSRSVGVVGSCRLHDPLTLLEARRACLRRFIDRAVTHTVASALQNFDIIAGATPPEVLRPLILEDGELVLPPKGDGEGLLASVDTFLVEVSDAQLFRCGDWLLQSDLLFRNLVKRHARALFAWYRQLTVDGRADAAVVKDAVEALKAEEVGGLDELTEVLRHTRLERQEPEDIAAEVRALAESRLARWIFVSHFAVEGDDGALMQTRRSLIAGVRDGAAAAGAEFFDPSILVTRFGREAALAGDGADLFEYAEAFRPTVARALLALLRNGPEAAANVSEDEPGTPSESESESTPMAPASVQHADIAPSIAAVERDLIAFHKRRLKRLGPRDSGLFDHYAGLIGAGRIFSPADPWRLDWVLNYLPAYDRYVVYRAGLGELGFALAHAGRKVAVWEPNGLRHEAIAAALKHLAGRHPAIADNFTLVEGPADAVVLEPGETSLGLAFSVVMLGEGDDEAAFAAALARTDALLLSPRHFLRQRPAAGAEAEVEALLAPLGYSFEDTPLAELVLARRTAARRPAPAPRAEEKPAEDRQGRLKLFVP